MIFIEILVMAGIQIQYKSMYPTKTWCNTYWICAVSMSGKCTLTLNIYPSQKRIA